MLIRWNQRVKNIFQGNTKGSIYTSKVHLPVTSSLLGPPSVEFNLIYCPHRPLYVFQTYKAFMEAEIVSDGIL